MIAALVALAAIGGAFAVLYWAPAAVPALLTALVLVVLIGTWWKPETRPASGVYLLHKTGAWLRVAAGRHLPIVAGAATFLVWYPLFTAWTDAPRAILLAALVALPAAGGVAAILRNASARLTPTFAGKHLPAAWVKAGYRLPPVPTAPGDPAIVLGEIHPSREYFPDGSWLTLPNRAPGYSPTPEYLTLGSRALATGTLILGAPGVGKTSVFIRSAVLPIFGHPSRPGGLVMDSKASLVEDVRYQMLACGREADFFPVGLTGCHYNILHMPGSSPANLAELLLSCRENLNGARYTAETRWIRDSAALVAEGIIGLLRLLMPDEYVTPLLFRAMLTDLMSVAAAADDRGAAISEKILDTFGGSVPTDPARAAKYEHYAGLLVSKLSDEPRFSNIYSGELIGMLIRLTDPEVQNRFNPTLEDLDFPGWLAAIERGLVVSLDCNSASQPGLSVLLGTALKLSYQQALIARPDLMKRGVVTSNRCMVLLIDESQEYISPSDPGFLALARESRSLSFYATQSLASLEERIGEGPTRTLLNNLRNKVLFSTGEPEKIADLIGKGRVTELMRSFQESQQDAHLSITGKFAGKSSVAESISESRGEQYIVEPKEITGLPVGTFLLLGHDGDRPIPVQRCYGRLYVYPPGTRHADTPQALRIQGGRYV